MSTFIWPRSVATYYYPYQLSTLYQPGTRIYDPDYSLWQDPLAYEKIERDTVVAHAMYTRQHLVAGREWTVQPGGPSPQDKALASCAEDMFKMVPRFSECRFLLARAVFHGSRFARIYGKREVLSLGGLPAQDWFRFTEFADIDKRRIRFVNAPEKSDDGTSRVEMQVWSVAGIKWAPMDHPEWFIQHFYQRDEESLGYGRGLLNALFVYWRAKVSLLENMLQAADRYGQGQMTVAIDAEKPGRTLKELQQVYIDALRMMRKDHIFAYDVRDKLQLIDAPGQAQATLMEDIRYLDDAMIRLILGSLLPSGAGEGGSFAKAEIEENSTEALIQYDREILSESITRDAIGLWLDLNAPQIAALGLADAKKPIFSITHKKKSDPQVSAQVIRALLDAGVALRRDEVYDQTGFTPPGPDDDVIEGREQLPPGIGGLPSLGEAPPQSGAA